MKKIIFLTIIMGICTAVAAQPPGKPEREVIDNPVRRPPPPPPQPIIREGGVYQEAGKSTIYVIQGGKKVIIPTIAALWLMGYQQQQVVTVAAGRLNNYPTFVIRSLSPTPGSIVYPPEGNHIALQGINGATQIFSRGKEIQLVELRGWFRDIHGDCNEDSPSGYRCANKGRDMHYGFELDMDWAESVGLDVHKLLRVGNISTGWGLNEFLHPGLSTSQARLVALPIIRVELNSWGWICRFPGTKPADWLPGLKAECPDIYWPFSPHLTTANGNTWQRGFEVNNRGPYVIMVGSILTDDPHSDLGPTISRWGANPQDGNHPARWTEMHPPDTIGVLPFQPARVMTRGIAFSAAPNETERLEFDLFPEKDGIPKPAPNARVNFSESTGPESMFPRGRNASNGIFITKFDDHIHVTVSIQGSTDIFGSSGRLKSIVKVWWERPAPAPAPRSITGTWAGTYSLYGNAAANFYSFRFQADGSMQVLNEAGSATASGSYTLNGNQLSVSYTYFSGQKYSAAGTLTGNELTGTWGAGAQINGGYWRMTKK